MPSTKSNKIATSSNNMSSAKSTASSQNTKGIKSTKSLKSPAIIADPKVVKRRARRAKRQRLFSNGTLAAAAMVLAALVAILVANTDAYYAVHTFCVEPHSFDLGFLQGHLSVEVFVNDFLMAIFFLLVGIELKYEMTVGELRKPRQAALPMLAAVGGVVVPAVIYIAFNFGKESVGGWAIPMATDIAFALGVMSLLGDRVASATKVFFSTLAIADDILAIVVIALFYGTTPSIPWLAASAVCVVVLFALNRARVYYSSQYIIVGAILWFCMFNSGIHATLAGVIVALFLPASSDIRLSALRPWLEKKSTELSSAYDEEMSVLGQHHFTQIAAGIEKVMDHVTPPLQRVERNISTLVNFGILPLFAFVNAQVRFIGVDPVSVLQNPVADGAFLGALIGKPIGIIVVTVILVRIGFARLPKGVNWHQIVGVGIMGGLGFTMSILIANLAFTDATQILAAKCAILSCSVVAAVLGCFYLFITSSFKPAATSRPAANSRTNAKPGVTANPRATAKSRSAEKSRTTAKSGATAKSRTAAKPGATAKPRAGKAA